MTNLDYYELPIDVVTRDGPFQEFKQDAAFVTVETGSGEIHRGVLVLHPNYVIAMRGVEKLPFDPSGVVRIYQTDEDLKLRSSSNWTFWGYPGDTR